VSCISLEQGDSNLPSRTQPRLPLALGGAGAIRESVRTTKREGEKRERVVSPLALLSTSEARLLDPYSKESTGAPTGVAHLFNYPQTCPWSGISATGSRDVPRRDCRYGDGDQVNGTPGQSLHPAAAAGRPGSGPRPAGKAPQRRRAFLAPGRRAGRGQLVPSGRWRRRWIDWIRERSASQGRFFLTRSRAASWPGTFPRSETRQ